MPQECDPEPDPETNTYPQPTFTPLHLKLSTGNTDLYSKSEENNCGSKNNCERPKTWATTRKGETRDFFRVLEQDYNEA